MKIDFSDKMILLNKRKIERNEHENLGEGI